MSEEKFEYAEEILVGLRKNISDNTGVDDSSKLIDAIIGNTRTHQPIRNR